MQSVWGSGSFPNLPASRKPPEVGAPAVERLRPRWIRSALFDRQAGCAPFGISVLKAPDLETTTAQQSHRLESQHAVRTTAIGNNLPVLRNVPETPRQFAQRYIDGLGQMSCRVLVLRPHIEHRDEAFLQALNELLPRDRLER